MKFDSDKQIEKAVNQLYDALCDAPYDTRFSWDELRDLAGLSKKTTMQRMYYVVNKVCVLLMGGAQRYLVTEMGNGKRIIKPGEHQLEAKKKVKRSVRIYRAAGHILASTNMDELSEEQKREVMENANKYATMEMFSRELLSKKRIGSASSDNVRLAGVFLDTIKLFTGEGGKK